jgi:hypothetical protein
MYHEVISIATWADVQMALESLPLSPATQKDYTTALKRGLEILQCNRLEDIPVNLSEFKRRFSYNKFNPAQFSTEQSYRAWRRKVIAALKGFIGILNEERNRRGAQDDWAALLLTASNFVVTEQGGSEKQIIPLRILADECRAEGWAPKEITTEHLITLVEKLQIGRRRRSIARGAGVLNRLRAGSACISDMLHPESFGEISRERRRASVPPEEFMAEAFMWIDAYCLGEQDEIMETYENAKAAATQSSYRAAFSKYLSTADRLGLLNGINGLVSAFERQIFNSVVREWLTCEDPALRISDRTKVKYVSDIRRIVKQNGVDVSMMDKAFRTNRNLKQGKADAQKMGRDEQMFCAWLLGSRASELLYHSMHIRFYQRCQHLLKVEQEGGLRGNEKSKITQLGVLAAAAAIEIWGPPLRIDNLRSIPIYGEKPWLFMPSGKRSYALFVLPKEPTKMKRTIRQKLLPGRTRALEILEWYIRVIRPRFANAETSIYLFPGFGTEGDPVSGNSLRIWLQVHGRREGINMNPHWFRHAVASLYIRANPNGHAHVAKLLDDSPETIRRYYAWVNDEQVLDEVQQEMLKLAGF